MSKRHWETHLYGYATALTVRDRWHPENLLRYRRKMLLNGSTEGEIMMVENFPHAYIRGGWKAVGKCFDREHAHKEARRHG